MMLSECFFFFFFLELSMIIDLTLVFVNFLEYPNGIGRCQHKIFEGKDQKS